MTGGFRGGDRPLPGSLSDQGEREGARECRSAGAKPAGGAEARDQGVLRAQYVLQALGQSCPRSASSVVKQNGVTLSDQYEISRSSSQAQTAK